MNEEKPYNLEQELFNKEEGEKTGSDSQRTSVDGESQVKPEARRPDSETTHGIMRTLDGSNAHIKHSC